MARNGSGSYALPAPYPSGFANGTVIDAPTMNTVFSDVQTALTASTAADGQTPITGNWNFASKNVSGIATLTATGAAFVDASTSGGMTVGNVLSVTKGGAAITGNSTITGTLSGLTGMTIASGGAAITGATFFSGAMEVTGTVMATTSLGVGYSGSTWTRGFGAPAANTPRGSIYSRTDGGVGTTLYVSQGGGTWNPIAGV